LQNEKNKRYNTVLVDLSFYKKINCVYKNSTCVDEASQSACLRSNGGGNGRHQ
jgi:hypothetical protein